MWRIGNGKSVRIWKDSYIGAQDGLIRHGDDYSIMEGNSVVAELIDPYLNQ